jgi:release factor glutamine methyltransferase
MISRDSQRFPAYVCKDCPAMKNCKELFHEIISGITLSETKGEIESIAYVLLADHFSVSRAQILAGVFIPWSDQEKMKVENALERINDGEPVQYISGKAFFFGRSFFVDPGVLIPRPETEELVEEVIRFTRQGRSGTEQRILDIGTGSGCIPVTLALEIPNATVMATDISDSALAVARQNVLEHKVQVQLLLHNIIVQAIPFKNLSVVVSNPPYIAISEKDSLGKNVVDFEPHVALFVHDEDPLLYYRVITREAKEALNKGGLLAFEINERYGPEVVGLLTSSGFSDVQLVVDISGKPRIVKGIKE